MDVQEIGRSVLLALGALLIARAAFVTLKSSIPSFALASGIGVLLLGLGTFGLPFMDKYKDYFEILMKLIKQGDAKAYARFYDHVADGSMPVDLAEAGIAFTLERPLPTMESTIDGAIRSAKGPPQTAVLLRAKEVLRGKKAVAYDLVTHIVASGAQSRSVIQQYDPAVQRLMVKPLQGLAPQRLQLMQLDAAYLDRLEGVGR